MSTPRQPLLAWPASIRLFRGTELRMKQRSANAWNDGEMRHPKRKQKCASVFIPVSRY
jgi:hypothetical protein